MFPIDAAIIGQVILTEHEYQTFFTRQSCSDLYTPSHDEYFAARGMAQDIENPPSPPYFKTKLALLINAIADLLPGSK